MTPEQKRAIDDASYETLLHAWRFQPIGSPAFQGERGDYFAKVMAAKKAAIGATAAVAASKAVGWGGSHG